MAEYDIDFGDQLAKTALLIYQKELKSIACQRAILYISLLSIEISLKFLLEKAGISTKKIRSHSHNINSLYEEVKKLNIDIDIGGQARRVSASRINSVIVDKNYSNGTVGALIEQMHDASQYPNRIRYGHRLIHLPPAAIVKLAECIVNWAKDHHNNIYS